MGRIFVVFLVLLFLSVQSKAQSKLNSWQLYSIYNAAREYNVDSNDLLRIGYVESHFNHKAINVNKNGTVDYGMFQINSVNWSTHCKEFDLFKFQDNAKCAAKLVSLQTRFKHSDKLWLSRYHSKTPKLKQKYARKLASVDLKNIGGR